MIYAPSKYELKQVVMKKKIPFTIDSLSIDLNPPLNEIFLDNADLKKMFNCGDKKLYLLRKSKQIPYIHLNGKILYPKKELVKVLRQKYIDTMTKRG